MAKFRFRAEAAIELRRKHDEEAQRALGEAKRATRVAEAGLAEEERVLAEALARGREEEGRAADMTRAIWYRNWLPRQRRVIEAAHAVVDERRRAECRAAEQAVEARRKVRALERLRERMWQAFLVAERRLEQKDLDALGGLRYVARRSVPEGA